LEIYNVDYFTVVYTDGALFISGVIFEDQEEATPEGFGRFVSTIAYRVEPKKEEFWSGVLGMNIEDWDEFEGRFYEIH
jgi:hypothetical protein